MKSEIKKTGIELIAQERREQIEKHGRTIENDVSWNDNQQLPTAAMLLIDGGIKNEMMCPTDWDNDIWLKMVRKTYKERLIIAGALIAAEIDRLQNQ